MPSDRNRTALRSEIVLDKQLAVRAGVNTSTPCRPLAHQRREINR